MKFNFKLFILCLGLPLLVGGLAGLITNNSMNAFQMLSKPTLSPPAWLFPVVWTILYILMGIASYLVLASEDNSDTVNIALKFYIAQLAVNFFWPILFFTFELYLFSFIWLLLLIVLVIITIVLFAQISKPAAYLMLPYLIWLIFAGYLNLSIYLLN